MPTLRPSQVEDVNLIMRNRVRAIVANAPGTGKTATAIVAIARTANATTPCLVVAPASVTRNWVREFSTWAPGLRVQLLESATEDPTASRKGDVFILSWALLDRRVGLLEKLNIRSVVADEAHFAKNPDTDRSMALRLMCRKDRGLLLLTGTPIVNNTGELEVLESYFDGQKPILLRRLLSDVAPDIPPKKRSYLHISLPPKHEAEYQRAHDDFEGWLRSKTAHLSREGMAEHEIERKLAAEALVKLGYLRRIVGKAKIHAAADFTARSVRVGEPLVCFCEHSAVIRGLSTALRKQRIRHVVLDGSTSTKKRQEAIDAFQRGLIPVILCSKAGKEGITLHAARHMLFVERFFTSADEDQAEDRIRRIGQKFATTIWILHAPGTVDERIDTIVRTKRRLIENTIGNEHINDTEIANVQKILSAWTRYSRDAKKQLVNSRLGLGDPMPPLPSPKQTHALVFARKSWKLKGAARWAKMNGFKFTRVTHDEKFLRLIVHPAQVFKDARFTSVTVSKSIHVISGTRVSKKAERRVRAQLSSRQRG